MGPNLLHCGGILVRVSTAMKGHQDQGNSYKGQHVIWAGLQVLRLSPGLYHHDGRAGQHPGRHGVGGAESSTSCSKGS